MEYVQLAHWKPFPFKGLLNHVDLKVVIHDFGNNLQNKAVTIPYRSSGANQYITWSSTADQ